MRTRRAKIGALVAIGSFIVCTVGSTRIAGQTTQPRSLGGRGWAETASVLTNGPIRLWIELRNDTDDVVSALTLSRFDVAPGFSRDTTRQACWADGVPACATVASGAGGWSLQPGDSVLVWADVKRAAVGQFNLTGQFTWTAPAKAGAAKQTVIRHGTLTIGPLDVQGLDVGVLGIIPSPLWMSKEVRDALKDLALPVFTPIAAAIVAFWYQRRQLVRNQRLATLNLMLAKSHGNAEQHYLPLMSNIETLLRDAKTDPALVPSDIEERLLFDLLLVFRRMLQLLRQIGGFYFKDRAGEEIITNLWTTFTNEGRTRLSWDARDALLSDMTVDETVEEFTARYRDPLHPHRPAHVRLLAESKLWLSDFALARLLLRLFMIVVVFEMNRPYEYWYGEKEPVPIKELAEDLDKLDAWIGERKTALNTEKQKELRNVLAQGRRYVQELKHPRLSRAARRFL